VLDRLVLYHLSHTPSPFCFTYFTNRVSHLTVDLPGLQFSYLCFSSSWDDRCAPLYPAFIVWDGISQTFCLGWFQTTGLLVSAS
jgi:hypothetical protein